MEEEKKKGRGGHREGAGRKRMGAEKRVMMGLSVPPEVKEKLAAKAREEGISVSELVTRMASHLS